MADETTTSGDTAPAADTATLAPVKPTPNTRGNRKAADAQAPAPAPEPVEAAPSVIDPVEGDDENVVTLKEKLRALVEALKRPGKEPQDFKGVAALTKSVTDTIIQFPKVPVLDTFLAFVEENIEGDASAINYMKGSTTLAKLDEQRVGFLYNLFADLAQKNVVPVNNAMVVSVLKKPEISSYYNRKVSVLKQNAADA